MRKKSVSLTLKKTLGPILLLILIVVMQIPIGSSFSTTQETFSSSGLIVYNQTPEPGELPTPNPSGSLNLAGVGGDYLLHYSDSDPSIWETSWVQDDLAYYASKGLTVSRLGFRFSDCETSYASQSTYFKWKMDRVLNYFDVHGIKVVFSLQNNDDMENYCGSQAMTDNWLQVTRDYKDDPRVSAFHIFSEPEHASWYDTWDAHITSKAQFNVEMMNLAKAIHAIDPNRIVILPFMGLGSLYPGAGDYSKWIIDLKSAGFMNEQNTMVDIVHPYYFENQYDYGLSVSGKVKWYEDYQINPMINAFGVDKCWSGETFYWYGRVIGSSTVFATDALQRQWLTSIINCFVKHDMGFDIWATLGNSNKRFPTLDCIKASNFGT